MSLMRDNKEQSALLTTREWIGILNFRKEGLSL